MSWTEEQVTTALRTVINSERLLNIDFGMGPEDDTLPERFTIDALPEGPSSGQTVPVTDMVRDYYRLRGWNEDGIPPGLSDEKS
jgi:aldehyde:ferredoxin oxidoreductase